MWSIGNQLHTSDVDCIKSHKVHETLHDIPWEPMHHFIWSNGKDCSKSDDVIGSPTVAYSAHRSKIPHPSPFFQGSSWGNITIASWKNQLQCAVICLLQRPETNGHLGVAMLEELLWTGSTVLVCFSGTIWSRLTDFLCEEGQDISARSAEAISQLVVVAFCLSTSLTFTWLYYIVPQAENQRRSGTAGCKAGCWSYKTCPFCFSMNWSIHRWDGKVWCSQSSTSLITYQNCVVLIREHEWFRLVSWWQSSECHSPGVQVSVPLLSIAHVTCSARGAVVQVLW